MSVLFKVQEKLMSHRVILGLFSLLSLIVAIIITIILSSGILVLESTQLFILVLFIPWAATVLFFIGSLMKNPPGITELRTCIITDEEIKFDIPKRKNFRIKWDEFDTIHAEKYVQRTSGRSLFYLLVPDRSYHLVFKGTKTRTFKFEGEKFKSRTRRKIFKALEKIGLQKNKDFVYNYYLYILSRLCIQTFIAKSITFLNNGILSSYMKKFYFFKFFG